jgi:hypothetical protein
MLAMVRQYFGQPMKDKGDLLEDPELFICKVTYAKYCHAFECDRRRGIGLSTGFIGLQCAITVTAYHNVHPLQYFSRTQHKAGNGSSACVPLQHASGIPCHQFLNSSSKTQTPTNERTL